MAGKMSFSALQNVVIRLKQMKCFSPIQKVHVRMSSKQALRKEQGFKMSGIREGGYLLLIVPITTLYLTIWQLKRRVWKLDLIKTLEEGFNTEPVSIPADLTTLPELEFKPVKVRGTFDYTKEVYIAPRTGVPETLQPGQLAGQRVSGAHVVTPFKLADRDLTILVNRGWYPVNIWVNEDYMKKGRVHGETELVGIVRKDQQENKLFWMDLSKAESKNGMTYFVGRKLENLSKVCGTAPVFIDAVPIENRVNRYGPREIKPVCDLKNDHLVYAITWFGMCVFSLYMWLSRFRQPATPSAIHKYLKDQELLKLKAAKKK